jgi:hypothetical protein
MSNPIWQRYPVSPGLRCVEMKDRAQARVVQDTRGVSPAALVTYFREASHRLWRDAKRPYPESATAPLEVRETDEPTVGG